MSRIAELEEAVRKLYLAQDPDREEWADWLYANHIFVVADKAIELAGQYGADNKLARAAALLHDIADVKMSRFNPVHEAESLKLAKELLEKTGFSSSEIAIVVNDALPFHSCHDGHAPQTLEGKVLATADALAHIQTDFYIYLVWAWAKNKTMAEIKRDALKKLERDYHEKIQFPEVKQLAKKDYEIIKELFSR